MSVVLPDCERVSDGRKRGVEVRVRDAAVLAGSAVVTWPAAVDRLGDVRRPPDGDSPSELALDASPQLRLRTAHRHRRMEAAVRQLGHVFGLTRNADIVLDQFVVRNEILVADWPVFTVTVERFAVQVLFAQPVALAAPDVGASADDARAALPAERLVSGVGVGLLEIVDEPLVVPLATRVAIALSRPRAPHEVARLVAILELVGLDVLGEVLVALRLPRFEERDLDAGFGESFRRPAA